MACSINGAGMILVLCGEIKYHQDLPHIIQKNQIN